GGRRRGRGRGRRQRHGRRRSGLRRARDGLADRQGGDRELDPQGRLHGLLEERDHRRGVRDPDLLDRSQRAAAAAGRRRRVHRSGRRLGRGRGRGRGRRQLGAGRRWWAWRSRTTGDRRARHGGRHEHGGRVMSRDTSRSKGLQRRRSRAAGMTMIEVLVAMSIVTLMMLAVWRSFSATVTATEMTVDIQERYSTVRNAMDRMAAELTTAYLSFNRNP